MPLRLGSLQGPQGNPTMLRLPLCGISFSSASPGHTTKGASVSQGVRGKPLLHLVGSLASWQCFNGSRVPSGPGKCT